jgi:uncharacterized protein (TIGR03067 family)
MRTHLLCSPLAILVVLAQLSAQETKTDKDRFQGEWEVVKLEQAGKDYANLLKRQSMITIYEGDKYTFKGSGDPEKGEFKLDPKAKMPTVDYVITDGEHKGKTQLGIYKFEGDTLTLCFGEEGAKTRPTSFTTRPDAAEYVLFVLKRKQKK